MISFPPRRKCAASGPDHCTDTRHLNCHLMRVWHICYCQRREKVHILRKRGATSRASNRTFPSSAGHITGSCFFEQREVDQIIAIERFLIVGKFHQDVVGVQVSVDQPRCHIHQADRAQASGSRAYCNGLGNTCPLMSRPVIAGWNRKSPA